ncbi:MAG: hypothetical protein Q8J97_10820, partial [Flavobacteriaceae bacterium]|nr:hypothetical protein [Flavobacteriaceae bacterium]
YLPCQLLFVSPCFYCSARNQATKHGSDVAERNVTEVISDGSWSVVLDCVVALPALSISRRNKMRE